MKEQRLLFLLLLTTLSLSAQVKGVVLDSISGKPIAYVNIWVENENIGTTSEENGIFLLEIKEEKNIVFSALGYETKILKSSEIEKVNLYPKVYEMPEVVLSIPVGNEEIEVGNSKRKFYLPEPQTVPWVLAKKFHFPSEKKDLKFIKNLIYYTNSEVENGKFRARVYEITNDSLPGDDLIYQELIINVKKGKQTTVVDVSKYNIQIPKEGVIVGFESLIIEENKYKQKATIFESKKQTTIDNYSPHIFYHYSEKEVSYTKRYNKWVKQQFSMYSKKGEKKVITPAINITLTN
ncbi:MAG: hypothetical protein ACI9FW_000064 [Flavobacterium sp.]|jgi:hypothetical protein